MRALTAVVVIVVLASLALWWITFMGPMRQQSGALDDEAATLAAAEASLTNQRTQLLDLQARAPELRADLDRLDDFIPIEPDQEALLELIQQAADASGITFTDLTFTQPAVVDGAPPISSPLVLGSITVTGSVQATYFQMVDFLRRLEIVARRAILIETVDVSQGEGGFPQITGSFSARIFAQILPPTDGVAVDEAERALEVLQSEAPAVATPIPLPTPAAQG